MPNDWIILCDYVYGNALDEVVLHKWSNQTAAMYYINDHLNSPAALLDGFTGAVAQRYEYDAYGVRHVFDADYTVEMTDQQTEVCTLTNVGFTGQRLEVLDNGGLQLAYYKNRWYDPELGRFMSQDPLGITPNGLGNRFNPRKQYRDGLNVYSYVRNRPIDSIDLLGLRVPDSEPDERYPDDLGRWGLSGATGTAPPSIRPGNRYPSGGAPSSCCKSLTDGADLANKALKTGKCKEWFEEHNSREGDEYTLSQYPNLPYTVLLGIHVFTLPGSDIIAFDSLCDMPANEVASLLIHELGHHYTYSIWPPERERLAGGAQEACQDAITNLE